MDLNDFISKTVLEIIKGTENSSKLTGKNVGLYSTGKSNKRHIEFDVAVTAKSGKQNSGGVGIQVFGLQVGGKRLSETSGSILSRIKFGIRIR